MAKLIDSCELIYVDKFDIRTPGDFTATPSDAVDSLCKNVELSDTIWEPACGNGALSEALIANGYDVIASDLFDRGYGISGADVFQQVNTFPYDIVTNPPEECDRQFIEKLIDIVGEGHKVAVFVKLVFLQGVKRARLFSNLPPKLVLVGETRYCCPKNGDFSKVHPRKDGYPYAWVIWEKGFEGTTELKWFK